jgi:hypothetical protein
MRTNFPLLLTFCVLGLSAGASAQQTIPLASSSCTVHFANPEYVELAASWSNASGSCKYSTSLIQSNGGGDAPPYSCITVKGENCGTTTIITFDGGGKCTKDVVTVCACASVQMNESCTTRATGDCGGGGNSAGPFYDTAVVTSCN